MFSFKQITSTPEDTIYIVDPSSTYTHSIREKLAAYKKRWNESLANRLYIVNSSNDVPVDAKLIIPEYLSYNLPHNNIITIPAIQLLTIYDLRSAAIVTSYEYTADINQAKQWLQSIDDANITTAFDFEAFNKLTDSEILNYQEQLTTIEPDTYEYNQISFKLNAIGLSHPSLTEPTHLSISISESEAQVIVFETQELLDYTLNWLITTEVKQVWHNISFDGKHIMHQTGRFPKNYEDSQLMWYTILNSTDPEYSKVGLKKLAGPIYKDWASSNDNFKERNLFKESFIEYAAIDAMATLHLYNEALLHPLFQMEQEPDTLETIWPIDEPRTTENRPNRRYFYESVIKPMIPSIVDMTLTGLHLDMDKVDKLRDTLDTILNTAKQALWDNQLIIDFQKHSYTEVKQAYIDDRTSKQRDVLFYTKPYKPGDMTHRSYLVNYLLKLAEVDPPEQFTAQLPDGALKWSVADIKKLTATTVDPDMVEVFETIIDKSIWAESDLVKQAMVELAKSKAASYNHKYEEEIENITFNKLMPNFNPNSTKQKQALFEFLEVQPIAYSKDTGLPSWGKDQFNELQYTVNDEIKPIIQELLTISESKTTRTNFVENFLKHNIDGYVYGNLRLGGTVS